MLREHNSELMIRWSPKESRASNYDPGLFVESAEQARKLIRHLTRELGKAYREKNSELITEIENTLSRVEGLAKKFFRWEQAISQSLNAEDLREIRKLPIQF
jgi:hypothetical protein